MSGKSVRNSLAGGIALLALTAGAGVADVRDVVERQILPGFAAFDSAAQSLAKAAMADCSAQNLQAPWLAFTAFFTFAIMLSLLVFIFEGVRDAFDPRKTFR